MKQFLYAVGSVTFGPFITTVFGEMVSQEGGLWNCILGWLQKQEAGKR
jgi:hypothetical protein